MESPSVLLNHINKVRILSSQHFQCAGSYDDDCMYIVQIIIGKRENNICYRDTHRFVLLKAPATNDKLT